MSRYSVVMNSGFRPILAATGPWRYQRRSRPVRPAVSSNGTAGRCAFQADAQRAALLGLIEQQVFGVRRGRDGRERGADQAGGDELLEHGEFHLVFAGASRLRLDATFDRCGDHSEIAIAASYRLLMSI